MRNQAEGHVIADVVLSARPAEAADRAVPGHWEGDLIIGTGRSAIGTLVERKSRSTLLVHLPRMEGFVEPPRAKNGPALAGYGAMAMNTALYATMTKLPQQLRQTLTWGRGKELSSRAQFALEKGTKVFFADPTRPSRVPPMRTPTGYCDSISPRAQTSRDGPQKTWKPSPSHSTTGPAKVSTGRPPRKYSKNSYAYSNNPVLQRPGKSRQDTSIRHRERLGAIGAVASIGTVGDNLDNTLAQTVNGYYEAKLVRGLDNPGP